MRPSPLARRTAAVLAPTLGLALVGASLLPSAGAAPGPSGGVGPAVVAAAPGTTAPGGPGDRASWTTGAKQGVGTSATVASKVWYSLSGGTMSEVYYPRVDVADSRGLELIVSDGRTFAERESTATRHKVVLVDPRALVYRQVNTDRDGRYRIVKTYVTDPARDTVLTQVRVVSLDGGRYQVYAEYDPALANSGLGDTARTAGSGLVATDTGGEDPVASALLGTGGFVSTSNGFKGTSDGWSDLAEDFTLDRHYASAVDGNVVQTARLPLNGVDRTETTLALGFGPNAASARETARASLARGYADASTAYAAGWDRYLDGLDGVPASVRSDATLRQQYLAGAMTLRAHEDKTYRGANIASLTVPWGEAQDASNAGVGGYHLVWARDLYQTATAQLAIGDRAGANRSVDYLFGVQQKADGSFPQNSLLDGTPYFGSLQLDEVALPIVLAWQLGRDGAALWRSGIKPAADFLVDRGPSTPQERWEEEGGYSPSTIAAEIAGLTAAADVARANGDDASAALYTGVADDWQRKVEGWTYTTTGPLGDGSYYERIDDDGDPDDGAPLEINNGGGSYDERAVVDGGFLELVRLGVKAPDDEAVRSSLADVDAQLKVQTPHGPMWYRYNHDGYGEKADGAPYDGTGVGRLWPLLTGERGEYALANGRTAQARQHLRTMALSANAGYLIPEQVWDSPDSPLPGLRFGEGTGSATPLAWSTAQFLRLAESIDEGSPVETPSVVADRYADGDLADGPALVLTSPEPGASTDQGSVTVAGTTDAAEVVVAAGDDRQTVPVVDGAFSTEVALGLGTTTVTVVAVGEDGGTSVQRRSVTSTDLGALVGSVDDPTGDDDGPGSYVYPAADAFVPGSFDLTRLELHDDGTSYNVAATIAGDVVNPWGGNQISTQRMNLYVRTGAAGGGAVDALPGTNARLASPYDLVVTGEGFVTPSVADADGTELGQGTVLALPGSHQIVFSFPKDAFGGLDAADLADASYAVTMMSRADSGEGVGNVRPVYSQEYWESTVGTGESYVHDYRFGGGAGELADNPARDSDTRDPNVLDVLVPAGQQQAAVLDWTAGAPVVLPYVGLEAPTRR